MNKLLIVLLVLAVAGASTIPLFNEDSKSGVTQSDLLYSPVENVYETPYRPVDVSYWEMVQRFVNQGPNMVKSKWSVGDVFIDSFNGSSVMVRLVDIAEDGTCTFMMDSVLDQTMTYNVQMFDIVNDVIPEEYIMEVDEQGNKTYYPLVVRGALGEYFLVLYAPPEDRLMYSYSWRANGMYEPDWTYTESFDFNVNYSMISLGTSFDDSIFNGYPYFLLEVDLNGDYVNQEWIEVKPDYASCVSEDLKKYAVDFRLPYAEELGIGDLQGNGAAQDVVWDLFKNLYVFDENGLTVTDQTVCIVYNFIGSYNVELNYSLFLGDQVNFWLEDTTMPEGWHPSRYYVDESGQLLLIDTYMPLSEPIYGSFMPCFKIKPQR